MQSIINKGSSSKSSFSLSINDRAKLNLRLGLILLILTLGLSKTTYSATVTWDGGAGDNQWTNGLNWDTDIVPNLLDDVIINGNTGFVGLSDEVQCKSLTIQASSELIIFSGGALEVEGSLGYGIYMLGTATMTNEGSVTIRDAQGHGFLNSGTLENKGSLVIQNVNIEEAANQNGIRSLGVFTNFSNGTITISQIHGSSAGICIRPSSGLNNIGNINISNSASKGIDLRGDLDNSGNITITQVIAVGLDVFGTFENMATGVIDISHVTNSSSSYGITNRGVAVNEGEIYISNIGSSGIYNEGSYYNENIIDINNNGQDGLVNVGVFENEENGRMIIGPAVIMGIRNLANKVINRGSIHIDDTNTGVFNQVGNFENYDSLTVKNSNSGIDNRDTVINLSTGTITLHDTSIALDNRAVSNGTPYLENRGSIHCKDGSMGLLNEYRFENYGMLDINNMTFRGVSNEDSLINHQGGEIQVSNVTHISEASLKNDSESWFSNDGQLNITNGSGVGINNFGVFIQLPNGSTSTLNILNEPFVFHVGSVIDVLGVLDINE